MKKIFSFCLLSLSSLCYFTLFYVSNAQAEETREAVYLNNQQNDWVLEYMRQMLETIGDVQGYLAEDNLQAAADRVKKLNQFANETKPKGIGKQFPPGFKNMAGQMNQVWNQLAEKQQSSQEAAAATQKLLNSCNACHRVYYLPPATAR